MILPPARHAPAHAPAEVPLPNHLNANEAGTNPVSSDGSNHSLSYTARTAASKLLAADGRAPLRYPSPSSGQAGRHDRLISAFMTAVAAGVATGVLVAVVCGRRVGRLCEHGYKAPGAFLPVSPDATAITEGTPSHLAPAQAAVIEGIPVL